MLFSRPAPQLSRITAPSAAEICEKSKPSPQGKALLQPGMTPGQYQAALEKNKMSVDSVHFLAHGMQPTDSVCWACQASRMNAGKLSGPELDALKGTECWLKNPLAGNRGSMAAALGKVDFTGPGSWAAQAGMWTPIPGAPAIPGAAGLTAAAVAGAIMLAAGLKIGPPMPAVPAPKLALPLAPPTPEMLLSLKKPQIPVLPALPVLDQPKLMKLLFPFIDLGKGVANGSVTCR
jgi:uncharacterized protein DUF6931